MLTSSVPVPELLLALSEKVFCVSGPTVGNSLSELVTTLLSSSWNPVVLPSLATVDSLLTSV